MQKTRQLPGFLCTPDKWPHFPGKILNELVPSEQVPVLTEDNNV
jgi:hypothetical protein